MVFVFTGQTTGGDDRTATPNLSLATTIASASVKALRSPKLPHPQSKQLRLWLKSSIVHATLISERFLVMEQTTHVCARRATTSTPLLWRCPVQVHVVASPPLTRSPACFSPTPLVPRIATVSRARGSFPGTTLASSSARSKPRAVAITCTWRNAKTLIARVRSRTSRLCPVRGQISGLISRPLRIYVCASGRTAASSALGFKPHGQWSVKRLAFCASRTRTRGKPTPQHVWIALRLRFLKREAHRSQHALVPRALRETRQAVRTALSVPQGHSRTQVELQRVRRVLQTPTRWLEVHLALALSASLGFLHSATKSMLRT